MKGRKATITRLKWEYVMSDLIFTALAFFLFNIFRYHELEAYTRPFPTLGAYLVSTNLVLEQVFIPLSLLGLYWLSGYYNRVLDKSRLDEFVTTLYTALIATVSIFFVILINDTTGLKSKDYYVIFMLFGLLFMLIWFGRFRVTSTTVHKIRSRIWVRNTLIVGNATRSRAVMRQLERSGTSWSHRLVGFISLDDGPIPPDAKGVWTLENLEEVCRENDVEEVVIALGHPDDKTTMMLLDRLFPLDIAVRIAPDTLSFITGDIRIGDVMTVPFVDITSPKLSECDKNVKRFGDVLASLAALVLLSPLMAVVALMIKTDSPGPVFYRQERLGRNRIPFMIWKFRSMRTDSEPDGPRVTCNDDPRVTRTGRFMRKYRIDELPQFWNILKGDMSFVGPRPERDFFVRQIVRKAPYYLLLFQVRPGLTSWGMVKYGYASSVSQMVRRSRYDLVYINNMSLHTDLRILAHTVKTVLSGAGK